MTTTNMQLPEIAAGQTSKEATHNEALQFIDNWITGAESLDISAGDYTIVSQEFRDNFFYTVAGGVAPQSVFFPSAEDLRKLIYVKIDVGNTDIVTLTKGATNIAMSPGSSGFFWFDGTADGIANVGFDPTGTYTFTATQVFAAETTHGYNLVTNAQLLAPSYTEFAAGSIGGTPTIDFSAGSVQDFTITSNITALAISNVPVSGEWAELTLVITQGPTGAFTIVWPVTTKWAGGVAPTVNTATGTIHVIRLATFDGGSTWYGRSLGLSFA